MSTERHYELLVGKILGMGSGILAAVTWNDLARTAITAFVGASVGYFTTILWAWLKKRRK